MYSALMIKKIHVTRTFAPLQFEALEPHRFEDLVRDLMYGYRDWQRIEATGRGGADSGFDIRAYERAISIARNVSEDDEDREEAVVAEGNLWMIQCKREKKLGAARIASIINEAVNRKDPPYGYVLAAPVNFTKKSYDAFRAAAIERGILEFQLLGRAELEDMLYQPKNDRVLFAFFGISFASQKRSRVTDIRATVNTKNKLYKIIGEHGRSHLIDVLVRDTNDTEYPDEGAYPDFKERPRWRVFTACAHHPEGVRFHVRRHYAYVNEQKKEWDYIGIPNLTRHISPRSHDQDDRASDRDLRERAEDFWNHLPVTQQAMFIVDALIPYKNVDFIDKEGDELNHMPHLYVPFGKAGPFDGFWEHLERGENSYLSLKGMTQISFFPKDLPSITYGKIHRDTKLAMPNYLAYRIRSGGQHAFFDFENQYSHLAVRDVVEVPNPETRDPKKMYAEVMFKLQSTVAELVAYDAMLAHRIREQAEPEIESGKQVTMFQLKQVYDFELERR